MKKEEKEKTLDDLWAEAEDYVPQSIEEVVKDLKSKFKKNPNAIYLESKDMDKILGPDKKHYKSYFDRNFDDNYIDNQFTETIAGDYLIFERFKEYRGCKVYEVGDDTGIFLIENKAGTRYMFYVSDTQSVKGVNNTLVFVDYDGDLTIYDIEKDEFSEGE